MISSNQTPSLYQSLLVVGPALPPLSVGTGSLCILDSMGFGHISNMHTPMI